RRVETELPHALDDAQVEARRGRRDLGDPRLARLADCEDVGERAAGVAADDPGCHRGLLCVVPRERSSACASVRVSPRIRVISSNAPCPAINGGESWITGSPR